MPDLITVIAVIVLAIVIGAPVIYILGFLISMVAAFFVEIADTVTHHHHGRSLPA